MEKSPALVISVIVIAVLLLFGASWYFSRDAKPEVVVTPVVDEEVVAPPVLITAKHQFNDGRHIVAGEVDLPTPCHILDHSVIVTEPVPETVTVHFAATTDPDSACAQVITPARFKVEFLADENASIGATLNGNPATFNLIPVGLNEDLKNFELFIKG